MLDTFKAKGDVELIVRDSKGEIKKRDFVENLIVNAGKELVAKRLVGDTLSAISKIKIGTGTNAPSATDTDLQTSYATQTATVEYESDYKAKASATFSFTETVAIREAGLFNGDTTPLLISRVNISYDMNNGDSLQVVWRISISA